MVIFSSHAVTMIKIYCVYTAANTLPSEILKYKRKVHTAVLQIIKSIFVMVHIISVSHIEVVPHNWSNSHCAKNLYLYIMMCGKVNCIKYICIL